jgi:hypothetical protein
VHLPRCARWHQQGGILFLLKSTVFQECGPLSGPIDCSQGWQFKILGDGCHAQRILPITQLAMTDEQTSRNIAML